MEASLTTPDGLGIRACLSVSSDVECGGFGTAVVVDYATTEL